MKKNYHNNNHKLLGAHYETFGPNWNMDKHHIIVIGWVSKNLSKMIIYTTIETQLKQEKKIPLISRIIAD